MNIRLVFLVVLLLSPFLAAAPAVADSLDCDAVDDLRANRRDRAIRDHERCLLWSGSTDQLKIYYPVPGDGSLNVTEADLTTMRDTVEKSLRVYRESGFLSGPRPQPPIYIWASRSPAVNDINAVTKVLNNASPCVINLFWGALNNGHVTPDQAQQSLAHEIFHCVQYSQLNMYVGRTSTTAWWSEGSADWASGIVFPAVDYENELSANYQQHKMLMDQCDPTAGSHCGLNYAVYATSLFFQDMANQKGAGAVFALLGNLSVRYRGRQLSALAATSDMDTIFQKFVQDYVDQKISDPGGGYMAQPDVLISHTFEVDNDQDIRVQGNPFSVYAYQVNFAAGKTYEITGLETEDRFRLSLRLGEGPWQDGETAGPITVNTGCGARRATIAVSSAKDSDASQEAMVRVRVTDPEAQCACRCARPVPACTIGHWQSAEAPQLDLFINNLMNATKTGRKSAGFETGEVTVDSADMVLDVATDGKFTHSTAIDYSGRGRMSGQRVSMSGGIHSTSTGNACLTQEGQLCLQYEATSQPVAMKITAMGITVPFASHGNTYRGSITMPFTCSASNLLLKPTMQGQGPIPTQELDVKYHR